MTPSRRNAFLLLVAAFVVGLLAGAGATAMATRADGPRRGTRSGWYLDHLSRELDLTGTQRDSVRAVLDRFGPPMDTLMQAIRPRLDSLRGEMRREIERFLDDRQRSEFERMRQHSRRDRERDGGADARR